MLRKNKAWHKGNAWFKIYFASLLGNWENFLHKWCFDKNFVQYLDEMLWVGAAEVIVYFDFFLRQIEHEQWLAWNGQKYIEMNGIVQTN